ncbi:MAG: N-acetylmuramoyl-L-alanine amidase [Bacilli bacterium]|nr:N-acetylmuramoyl-L-alanine amidase [Bacilli bacterium]
MKKTLLFVFSLFLGFSLFGCQMGGSGNGGGGDSYIQTPSLKLKEVEPLKIGETVELKCTLTLINGTVEFSSSNEKVITVSDKGVVEAISSGTATITAKLTTTDNLTYQDEIEIIVEKNEEEHIHEFVEGKCECGEVDPDYVPPVEDKEAPVFNKTGSYKDVYELNWGKTFDPFEDVDVVDNVEGNINDKVEIVTDLNNKKYGEYTVTYKASDDSGNESELVRTVKVVWNYDVQFIGHAGSYYGLMNSEEAVLYAIEKLQYQAIEVDIKQSKDGVFILCHDDTFGGYTLAETNWDVLKDVEVTSSRNSGYPSQNGSVTNSPYTAKLLTLERFLQICKEYNVKPVLELKASKGITSGDQSRMDELMALVESKGDLNNTIILTSQLNCLIWLRNNGYNNIECQYLVNSLENQSTLNNCKNYNFTVSINVTATYSNSDEWVFKYQDAGIKISTYTFTQYVNYSEVQKWINIGVDYVTCDWHKMDELNLEPSPIEKYTVTFKDYDGEVLGVSTVGKNGSATAPANPKRQGYEFTGWDKSFDKVTSNLVVTATYTQVKNAIIYIYEDGSPEESVCTSVQEFAEVFWQELYTWSGSTKAFETFKSEALAKWKAGNAYNDAKVYSQGAKGELLEGYFVSSKANYDRWMPWMMAFDTQVNAINKDQTAWGSTYVGYLRLYALLQQSASYWTAARNEAVYSTMTKRAVLPTEYVTGIEIEIPELYVTDGRTFLGWYDQNGNLVTKVGATQTGQVILTAKWSDSTRAESFEITQPERIVKFDSYQLVWSFTPSNTTNKKVKFNSSDNSILSINEDGVITTYKEGVVTITVEVLDNQAFNKVWEVEVYFDPFIDGSYNDSSVMKIGDSQVLDATLYGLSDSLVWTSLNPSIATVNNGVVTGIAKGYAEIKVSAATNSNVYFVFGITVVDEEDDAFFSIINDAHNAETHVTRDLHVAYDYFTDVFVSASDLLFNWEYYVDRSFEDSSYTNHSGKMSSVEFITVHYTAGTSTGSNAKATANYMAGNSSVSIHYTTGNDGIFSVLDDSLKAWHAGDGTGTVFEWIPTGVTASENVKPEWGVIANNSSSTGYYFTLNGKATTIEVPMTGTTSSGATKTLTNPGERFTYYGPAWKVVNGEYYMGTTWVCFTQVWEGAISSRGGNNNSIGIESACNKGSDLWYTYQITAQLVAHLVEQNNLDLTRVVGHNMFSGKDCPQTLLANNGELWEIFMEAVEAEYKMLTQMSDYSITCKSNNPDILSDNGRIVSIPRYSTTVSYTVTVTNNTTGVSKTNTYSTIVHGEYTE